MMKEKYLILKKKKNQMFNKKKINQKQINKRFKKKIKICNK